MTDEDDDHIWFTEEGVQYRPRLIRPCALVRRGRHPTLGPASRPMRPKQRSMLAILHMMPGWLRLLPSKP